MITNAIFISEGVLAKNPSMASRPPADAPIPTMGRLFADLLLELVETVFLSDLSSAVLFLVLACRVFCFFVFAFFVVIFAPAIRLLVLIY